VAGVYLADIGATECGANGLTHCDDGFIARGWTVFPDVKLDSVGNGCAPPLVRMRILALDSVVGA
jgi:hypothetical protein